jgi:hypothetical protein
MNLIDPPSHCNFIDNRSFIFLGKIGIMKKELKKQKEKKT